jgi:hypothetical protein
MLNKPKKTKENYEMIFQFIFYDIVKYWKIFFNLFFIILLISNNNLLFRNLFFNFWNTNSSLKKMYFKSLKGNLFSMLSSTKKKMFDKTKNSTFKKN